MKKQSKYLTNLLLTLIFLVSILGCKVFNIPFGGGGISESTDPKEAVTAAYKKFMEQKSYHSVVKTKNSMATTEMELEFLAPDKFSIKNNVANYKTEIIAIGNDSFMRSNDGKWTKAPAAQALPVNDLRKGMTEEAIKSMKDFQFLGKENLDGKETLAYKFNNTYMGESSSKIWISTETGLPLRVDSEGSYGGTKLEISVIYDYSKEIRIEAPVAN